MNATKSYSINKGFPSPFGTSKQDEGINFALASKSAVEVTLCLYDRQSEQPIAEIPLSSETNKTGDVWHILIRDLPDHIAYAYRIKGGGDRPPRLHNIDKFPIADPYALEMATRAVWGAPSDFPGIYLPICEITTEIDFDWGGDVSPGIPFNDLIIYEMHVRGFTQDTSSSVKHPGTFLGVIEKIPHLLELGVNAVELMPVSEFDELEYRLTHPHAKKPLYNYWGYSPVSYFSPMKRYASKDFSGTGIKEFKMMVKELHRNKIEVILDVVFNHTAEGGETGTILSFKGIDDAIYYMLDKEGDYLNFSGCGNTFNSNQPRVLELIVSCLRYWVTEMHVDGFRFDLASALTRGTDGQPLLKAPLIEAITTDPILAGVKLIAEPWDAIGLYQVGHFCPETRRWSEWNGKYRDGVRRFMKGSKGANGEFAMRICGSEDLYHSRSPVSSINFVTAHDGFTLADLVSYNVKHNMENGEDNCDGSNDNESWNCGVEGQTSNTKVLLLRERQMRNFLLALMVSQGVPMLLMGDEYGHTKFGNNNTWCQDNRLNWFLWDKLQAHKGFFRYFKKLIHFRKSHPVLRRTTFLTNRDVDWHGIEPLKPDWSGLSGVVALTIKDHVNEQDLYIAFNAQDHSIVIFTPSPPYSKHWHWVVNTANPSPLDIYDDHQGPVMKEHSYKMIPYSAIMLKAF